MKSTLLGLALEPNPALGAVSHSFAWNDGCAPIPACDRRVSEEEVENPKPRLACAGEDR